MVTMKTSGYSGTPLEKKLGIKANFKIKLVNQPDYYFQLFSAMPPGIENVKDNTTKKDFIHYFAKKAEDLSRDITSLKNELKQNGMIWISWQKKSSGMATDLSDSIVRDIGLKNGLVDVKTCAVDDIWSGLKFVIPVKDRR